MVGALTPAAAAATPHPTVGRGEVVSEDRAGRAEMPDPRDFLLPLAFGADEHGGVEAEGAVGGRGDAEGGDGLRGGVVEEVFEAGDGLGWCADAFGPDGEVERQFPL